MVFGLEVVLVERVDVLLLGHGLEGFNYYTHLFALNLYRLYLFENSNNIITSYYFVTVTVTAAAAAIHI